MFLHGVVSYTQYGTQAIGSRGGVFFYDRSFFLEGRGAGFSLGSTLVRLGLGQALAALHRGLPPGFMTLLVD